MTCLFGNWRFESIGPNSCYWDICESLRFSIFVNDEILPDLWKYEMCFIFSRLVLVAVVCATGCFRSNVAAPELVKSPRPEHYVRSVQLPKQYDP